MQPLFGATYARKLPPIFANKNPSAPPEPQKQECGEGEVPES